MSENEELRIRSIDISEGENRSPNPTMLKAVGFSEDDFKKSV
ncbi:hypothetical protein RJD24_03290 [Bacillaceae bacterium IKA-2]|nr:hypothetical protein RJD24_03290 [Bacillaceae bacterium IKA-2]